MRRRDEIRRMKEDTIKEDSGEEKKEIPDSITISLIDYDSKNVEEKKIECIEDIIPYRDKKTVTWINIDGVHDFKLIEKIGSHFKIHHLLIEDIMNTGQRPKMEDFEDYIFIILKMLDYDKALDVVDVEQVSLIMGDNYVISFQEKKGDVFDSIRERIRSSKGRIRNRGTDYLVYAIMDTIVDNYFVILEELSGRTEEIEEELLQSPTSETLQIIHATKREVVYLRKSVWPLREVLNNMDRIETPLIDESTNIYFRDVYDHTIQVVDVVESVRDMVGGMMDIYLSSVSNRMNEVMKVLTIFASIFIPLTFVAGVYGMNFRYMPELDWKWGYFSTLGFMVVIGVTMLFYFKRKDWL